MLSKLFKLPKFSLSSLTKRPSKETIRKMAFGGLLAGAVVGAFYLGRHGGLSEVRGQGPQGSYLEPGLRPGTFNSPKGHVVAYIYGNIPVTREELGEYLVDRVGAERLDFLINRKIIDKVCAEKNIRISEAEINAQLEEDLKTFGCSAGDFVNKVLRTYNKTMFEWREDVIRPKLALERYVQDTVKIGEEDIRKGFEAKFGPKVECRMIVITKEQLKDKDAIWGAARGSTSDFEKWALKQPITQFASSGGKIPPIHKHFADPNIEEAAFKLQKGETSPLIYMPDGTMVILHCVQRIDADTTKRLDEERMSLHKLLFEARLAQMVMPEFNKLRAAAAPQVFLRREFTAAGQATAHVAPQAPSPPQTTPAQGAPGPDAPRLATQDAGQPATPPAAPTAAVAPTTANPVAPMPPELPAPTSTTPLPGQQDTPNRVPGGPIPPVQQETPPAPSGLPVQPGSINPSSPAPAPPLGNTPMPPVLAPLAPVGK